MTKSSRRYLVPYLAVVAAGLAALNWGQATTPIDVTAIAPEPAAESAKPALEPATPAANSLRSLAELSETVMRPLFRSDRRPPAAKPAAETAPAQPPQATPQASADTLRLVGMMRSGAQARRALIRVAGLPAALWVEKGGEISGWKVGSIEDDRVLIERNGDRAELKLFAPKPVDPPPQ